MDQNKTDAEVAGLVRICSVEATHPTPPRDSEVDLGRNSSVGRTAAMRVYPPKFMWPSNSWTRTASSVERSISFILRDQALTCLSFSYILFKLI